MSLTDSYRYGATYVIFQNVLNIIIIITVVQFAYNSNVLFFMLFNG